MKGNKSRILLINWEVFLVWIIQHIIIVFIISIAVFIFY
jgi:hypothetical protein